MYSAILLADNTRDESDRLGMAPGKIFCGNTGNGNTGYFTGITMVQFPWPGKIGEVIGGVTIRGVIGGVSE